MDIPTQLAHAKDEMYEAAKHLMTTPAPRDTNLAWKQVAMQFSEEFVKEHYSALQQAFDNGLSEKEKAQLPQISHSKRQ